MVFNLSELRNVNWKRVIVIGLLTVVVTIIAIACISQYRGGKAASLQMESDARARQQIAIEAAAEKETKRQALINRLVSICMETQQSYDKLTVKEKTAKVRPDCTVTE
jgi:type VI protein secretion system component VasK